jgi:hypothetical protein
MERWLSANAARMGRSLLQPTHALPSNSRGVGKGGGELEGTISLDPPGVEEKDG